SAADDDLVLGGKHYDRGLGTRSGIKLTYSLDGKFKRFEAVLGLDDISGKQGRVRVRILVDGKPRDVPGLDKELTWDRTAKEIAVDVSDAKELILIVEPGSGGSVQDHVDWGNARLVR